MNDLTKYIMGVAAKSNIEKRQVGCVVTCHGDIVAEGYNNVFEHAETMALEAIVAEGKISGHEYKDLELHVTHPPCPECAKAIANFGITKVHVVEAFMKFDGDKTRYDLVDGDYGQKLYNSNKHKASVPLLLFNAEKQLRNGVPKGQMISTMCITEAVMEHFDLTSQEVFTDIAEVLTFGARKYKPNNWRQCDDFGRYLAAAWRHWFAIYEQDELVDPESGLKHIAHFMTNIMFLHTKLVQIRD